MMAIAVIAVCLGVWHEEPVLGIVLAVAVAPALGYTVFLAAKTKARGRPMAVFEKVDTFIAAIVGVVVIELSTFIAFFVTCFPIGLVAFAATGGINNKGTGITGVVVAVVIGGAAAIAAAYMTYRSLTRKGRHGG